MSVNATTEAPPLSAIGVWRYRPQLALMALLLVEVLYLTISFDTQALEKAPSIWTVLVGWSPQYLRLAIAITVVMLLPGCKWLRDATPVTRVGDTRTRLPFLAFHAVAFLLFARLTGIFFVGGDSVALHPALWSAAWGLTGAATFVSWALAVYPHERWRAALIERRVLIAWSIAAGTTVWAAGLLTEALWPPLARYTFAIVRWVLSRLYADVSSDAHALRVGTPAFRVVIAPECSGYEGVGLILAFLAIYLVLFRKDLRFPGALLLLPIGAITIWILNALRIIALVVIGTSGWPDIAAGGFHSQAGWLIFNAVGLGFVAIINLRGYFMAHAKAAGEVAASPTFESTAAYLGPFVAMLAAAMLTGAVSAGFDWLYALRIVAIAAVMWSCRKTYACLNWTCSWGALAIGVGTFAVWIAMFPEGLTSKAAWPAALQSVHPSWAASWLALRLVGYVIAVPVAEELAFRVYVMRRVTDSDIESVAVGAFSWPSFVISSALFGAFHGALWPQGVIAGMAFACALYRRRAVGDAVLAHATTNALIAMYVFATGRWSVWS